MPRWTDLVGKRFGRLVVLRRDFRRNGKWYWRCLCDCGAEKVVFTNLLTRTNGSRSCGCLQRETRAASNRKHGRSGDPIFAVWRTMIARCHAPYHIEYRRYKKRGIYVCDRWRNSFTNFLADMGERPSDAHTIERIDNNGPYSPKNCRWATKKDQARNRHNTPIVTFRGDTKSLAEWCEQLGFKYRTVWRRIHMSGWPIELALSSPLSPRNRPNCIR